MLTKANIKEITRLQQKKYRKKEHRFIVEGHKSVLEFLKSNFNCVKLWVTPDYTTHFQAYSYEVVSDAELKKLSCLVNPQGVLAVFEMPPAPTLQLSELIVALDYIQDPGNLGTLIRLCDWFGVRQLVCSHDTADVYSPKTVQASMGSLTRVEVFYTDLPDFLAAASTQTQVYGAFMDGEDVYKLALPNKGILLMGNEANGISAAAARWVSHRISIPQKNRHTASESLNVAMAAAILLSEFKRSY